MGQCISHMDKLQLLWALAGMRPCLGCSLTLPRGRAEAPLTSSHPGELTGLQAGPPGLLLGLCHVSVSPVSVSLCLSLSHLSLLPRQAPSQIQVGIQGHILKTFRPEEKALGDHSNKASPVLGFDWPSQCLAVWGRPY